ncbi:MAG: zinc ribbon domain-containing protein, partial [Nitrososphaerota archaeon]
ILSFLEIFRGGIWAALAAWVVYSILEAFLYLRTAGRLKIRLLYASPISLVGVGAIGALIVMIWDQFKFPGEIKYGDLTLLFFGGAACLVASALITGVAALQVGGEKPTGERELESLLVTLPQYSSTTPPNRPQPTHPTARPREASITIRATRTALIHLEVISRSDVLVCLKCGASAAIGADSCPECGERFKKAASGLRCPVCKAPFSIAKPLSAGHYVCGQCFSDIRAKSRAS